MLSVQTVHSEPVPTISSYMNIFSANCSYSYESNNYYGSNEVLQLLVFSVKCDNNNCKRKLQTFQRKNLIWVTHNFKRLAQPESINYKCNNQHSHSLSNFIPQLTPLLSKLYLFSMNCEYSQSSENITSKA